MGYTDKILLIDDDMNVLQVLKKALGAQFNVDVVSDIRMLPKALRRGLPYIIILDHRMPLKSGENVIKELKKYRGIEKVVILILSAHIDPELRHRYYELGAHDVLKKPFNIKEIVAKTKIWHKVAADRIRNSIRIRKLKEEACIDHLTGAFNRQYGFSLVEEALEDFRSTREPSTLLFLDLDNFKHFNNHYGHQTGDRVLKEFANHVLGVIRDGDSLIRYGGDEFLLLLRGTEGIDLSKISSRLLKMDISEIDESLTVTIGQAECSDIYSPADWIHAADSRMLDGKRIQKGQIYSGP